MAKKTPDKAGKKGNVSGKSKDIKAQLAALAGSDWDDTEENEGFGEVPTGDYYVKIEKATMNNSQSSGRLQVSFELTIVGAPTEAGRKLKNRKLFKHEGLDTPENRGRLRASLAKLGLPWPGATELPDTLEEIIGTYALVHVNTKPSKKEEGQMSSWTNFVKAVDEDEIDTDDEEDVDEEDVEEEEGEEPKKGKKTANKPKKEEPEDEDEEDDAEEDEDDADDTEDEDSEDEDEDEEEDEKPKKSKSKKTSTVEEASITATFDADDIDKKQTKSVKALAEKLDFDPDNYEDMKDLLVDLGEHVGLSGKFSDAGKLLAKITAKAAESDDDDDTEEDD